MDVKLCVDTLILLIGSATGWIDDTDICWISVNVWNRSSLLIEIWSICSSKYLRMNGEWMDAVDSCVQDLDTMMLGAQGDQSKGSKLLKSNESWLRRAPKMFLPPRDLINVLQDCFCGWLMWLTNVSHCNLDIDNQELSAIMSASGIWTD